MSFKLPQTTKDFFDIIRAIGSYFSIAGFGILLLVLTLKIDFKNTLPLYNASIKTLIEIIGVIIIIAPIIAPSLYNGINRYILKKRKLSNIIIEKQDIIIDIIEKGNVASYFEKIIFRRIGGKNPFTTKIEVAGSIENIHSLNCFYNLNNEKNKITLYYVNNTSKMNNFSSLVKGQDKFLIFSAILKDTFKAKIENWDLLPINYSIDSTLEISLPNGDIIKSAKIFRVSEQGQETEIEHISPIIFTENGRQKILMKIVNYDYGEMLRLKWELI